MCPRPKMIKRRCGGYLAVSPRGSRLLIGVTADTEHEAHILFIQSYRRTIEIVDGLTYPTWANGLEWGPLDNHPTPDNHQ